MINHGFRRLALAHSLLPAAPGSAAPAWPVPDATAKSDDAGEGQAAALDGDGMAQDHPAVHM